MLFDNVVALCESRGITIAKLETETGLGNATVRGWKTATPTVTTLKKVADYFGVTIDELLTENGKREKQRNEALERLKRNEKEET